jgi:hypothetical protein
MTTELVQAQPQQMAHVGPQVLPSRTMKYLEFQSALIANSPLAGPYRGKPDDLLPVLVRGAELGLQPMTSIEYLYVIENRVYPASKLVGAMFRRAGHWYRVIEETAERSVIKARHKGDPIEDTLTMEFTIEQARQMGVLDVTWKRWTETQSGKKFAQTWVEGSNDPRPDWAKPGTKDVTMSKKDNWHKDPAGMLYYRCLRRVCERVDPGVLMALGPLLEDATTAYVSPSAEGVQFIEGQVVEEAGELNPAPPAPFVPPADFVDVDSEEGEPTLFDGGAR